MTKPILFYLTVICVFVVLTVLFVLTPYLGGKNSCFGIFMEQDVKNSREIKKYKIYFSAISLFGGAIFASLALFLKSVNALCFCASANCVIELLFFVSSKKTVMSIIAQKNSEDVKKPVKLNFIPSTSQKSSISLWWEIVSLPVIISTTIVSILFPKDYGFLLPIFAWVLGGIFFCSHIFLIKHTYTAHKINPEADIAKQKTDRRYWSVLITTINFLAECLIMLLQLSTAQIIKTYSLIYYLPFIFTIIICSILIFFAYKK